MLGAEIAAIVPAVRFRRGKAGDFGDCGPGHDQPFDVGVPHRLIPTAKELATPSSTIFFEESSLSLRFHEIAESGHRILNPLTPAKLDLLGEICRLRPGMRQLDLACGAGEMLAQWSARYDIEGVGVDLSKVFLDAAVARAAELGVTSRLRFVHGDAADHVAESEAYDVVSCVGATWIGGNLAGTIELMRPALRPGGLLVIGEVFWISEPPEEVCEANGMARTDYASLIGTNAVFESAGFELIEMVLSDADSFDRYVASQWRTMSDWLREHPTDPDATEFRDLLEVARRAHLLSRNHLGWGVFVLRAI